MKETVRSKENRSKENRSKENRSKENKNGLTRIKGFLLMGSLLLLLASASLLLPSAMIRWQDEQRVGRGEAEEVPEVMLTAQEDMLLLEKVNMLGRSSVNALPLVQGKHYDQESVENKAKEELKTLQELGIALEGCDLEQLVIFEKEITFYMDSWDSERSMMLWTCHASAEDWEIYWSMDDETGKILNISQTKIGGYDSDASMESGVSMASSKTKIAEASEQESEAAKEPAKEGKEEGEASLLDKVDKWGDYLGCQVVDKGDGLYNTDGYTEIMDEEFNAVMSQFMEKGLSFKDARMMAAESLGYSVDRLPTVESVYGVLEEGDTYVAYYFQKETLGQSFFISSSPF